MWGKAVGWALIALLALAAQGVLGFLAPQRCAVRSWKLQNGGRAAASVVSLQAKKGKKRPRSAASPASQPVDDLTESESSFVEESGADEEGDDIAWDGSLSPQMMDKLRTEATEPFRVFRLFVYISFAIGAGIGGFTALTQLAATLGNAPDSLPLTKAVTNVVIDWGVVGASVWAWNFENNLKKETQKQMSELREKEGFKLTPIMKERREQLLSELPLTITAGEDQTVTWSVKELRERGKQHVILLAAPKAQMSDALLGARIAKNLFVRNGVVIVPYVTEDGDAVEDAAAVKGFGQQVKDVLLDKDEYVAKPVEDEEWKKYIDLELSDAEKQGNEDARKRGIGVVMNKDGKIIRRGLGQPEWRDVVAELVGEKKPGEYDDAYVPMFKAMNKKKKGKKGN